MGGWKIIEQLREIQKRQVESYHLLVKIGGMLPSAHAEQSTPEEPATDIAEVRLVIERLTKYAQENLELARQIHENF